ncbi:MAG: hypothetical protein KJO40_18285 [Deltaproteobacteria bacterium]|nr:hypothetical protein [Deltaproteobacteria bacterium]
MKIEDMIEEAVAVNEGETFLAYLFPPYRDHGWRIGIIRPDGVAKAWEGFAEFPAEWGDYAKMRHSELFDDTDIEDVLREWAKDERVKIDFAEHVAKSEGL